MANASNVKFWRGTQSQFPGDAAQDGVIYFVSAAAGYSGAAKVGIYLGSTFVAAGEENFASALAGVEGKLAGITTTVVEYVNSVLGITPDGDESTGSIMSRMDAVEKLLGVDEKGALTGSAIKTTEAFKVTGVTVGNLTDGLIIDANTDVMSILKKMLAKRLTAHSIKSNPSASITGGKSGTVEVGTELTSTLVTAYADGEFTGMNKSYVAFDKPLGCAKTSEVVTADGADLGAERTHTVVLNTRGAKSPVYKVVFAHGAGNNAGSAEEFKVFDNMGVEISAAEYNSIKKAAGNVEAQTAQATAAYYQFYGSYADNKDVWTSAEIRTLTSNWSRPGSVTITKGHKMVIVAMPKAEYDKAELGAKNGNTQLADNFSKVGTFVVNCAGTHTAEYNLYAWIAPEGAGANCTFTLSY